MSLVDSGSKGTSFLIGASIFITTCLIGYNFEYRLIFLLLTIPQILSWFRENKIMAVGLLVLSILIVWQSFIMSLLSIVMDEIYYQLISHLVVILLFYTHLSILLNFLNNFYNKLSKERLTLSKNRTDWN